MLWKYCEYFKFERAIGRAKTNVPVSSKNRNVCYFLPAGAARSHKSLRMTDVQWRLPFLEPTRFCVFISTRKQLREQQSVLSGKAAPDGVELITGSICFGIIRYCQGPDGAVLPSWRCSKKQKHILTMVNMDFQGADSELRLKTYRILLFVYDVQPAIEKVDPSSNLESSVVLFTRHAGHCDKR
ncbi:unnamed protein product, partial [Nesidiocoris tenuis]